MFELDFLQNLGEKMKQHHPIIYSLKALPIWTIVCDNSVNMIIEFTTSYALNEWIVWSVKDISTQWLLFKKIIYGGQFSAT